VPRLELVRADHAPALLTFEQHNRSYFAAAIPDRGDAYFAEFAERHRELLAWQANGTDFFHVLVEDGDDAIVGRVNLTEVADGSAELGYRIAQRRRPRPGDRGGQAGVRARRRRVRPACAPRIEPGRKRGVADRTQADGIHPDRRGDVERPPRCEVSTRAPPDRRCAGCYPFGPGGTETCIGWCYG
jgi:hypothetical protein